MAVGFLCGYLASQLKSPVRVRVNLEWNEESRSVRAVRRFTKLLAERDRGIKLAGDESFGNEPV